jgi:hypothetical protein
MFDDEECPAEDEAATIQMDEVHGEVEEKPCKEVEKGGVVTGEKADKYEEIQRVEYAQAGVGDVVLDFLELLEVAEHAANVVLSAAQHIEDVMVEIDQDAPDGKPENLHAIPEGKQDKCRRGGKFCVLRQSHRLPPANFYIVTSAAAIVNR